MDVEHITKTIEDFLRKLTIDFDRIEYIENNTYNTFLVHSQDAGILIGSRGENLEAFGFLIRRMVERNQKEDEERDVLIDDVEREKNKSNTLTFPNRGVEKDSTPFIVDVNNYQTKKIQDLVESAHISARRAKLFKQNVELSPMTSYERMIVHSVFTDDPEISTESYGDGKFRRVVLKFTSTGESEMVDTRATL